MVAVACRAPCRCSSVMLPQRLKTACAADSSAQFFPVRKPGAEDPFNGPGGAQRRAQFFPCLVLLVFLALGPLQPIYAAVVCLVLLIVFVAAASMKLCPKKLESVLKKMPGSSGAAQGGENLPT